MLSKSNFCFLSYVASDCLLASPIIHDLSCHHEECQQPVLLPELLNCWCSALARALHFPCRAILCYCISFFPTEPDLVETKPCSFNSSRECECRPGLFCQSSVKYTCLRCQQHTVCKPGFGVKVRGRSSYLSSLPFLILALGLDLMHFGQSVLSHYFNTGTSSTDVICEKCPPGTFSNQNSSTNICKPHTK